MFRQMRFRAPARFRRFRNGLRGPTRGAVTHEEGHVRTAAKPAVRRPARPWARGGVRLILSGTASSAQARLPFCLVGLPRRKSAHDSSPPIVAPRVCVFWRARVYFPTTPVGNYPTWRSVGEGRAASATGATTPEPSHILPTYSKSLPDVGRDRTLLSQRFGAAYADPVLSSRRVNYWGCPAPR